MGGSLHPRRPRQSKAAANLPADACRACFEEYLEYGRGATCPEHNEEPLAEIIPLPEPALSESWQAA